MESICVASRLAASSASSVSLEFGHEIQQKLLEQELEEACEHHHAGR